MEGSSLRHFLAQVPTKWRGPSSMRAARASVGLKRRSLVWDPPLNSRWACFLALVCSSFGNPANLRLVGVVQRLSPVALRPGLAAGLLFSKGVCVAPPLQTARLGPGEDFFPIQI